MSASINPICFSINRNCFKIFKRSLCLFRSIKTNFWSIENRESGFLKLDLTCSNLLYKKVFKLFSLSEFDKACPQIFCRFPPDFLQGFPLYKPVSPLCPSFCILFHVFMHFSCISLGIFGTFQNGVFDVSSHFFWNWSLGFVPIML